MNTFSSYKKSKEALIKSTQSFTPKQQLNIKKAIVLAEKCHSGQTRSELGPKKVSYVIHCLRAANWLIEQRVKDPNMIIATILHDTLEDTNLSSKKIQNIFGLKILRLVLGVTRPHPPNETEKQKRRNKPACFKKILEGSKQVRLIKTADLLDNIRSWQYITNVNPLYKKLPRWIDEAEQYYLPIAKSVNQNAVLEMNKIIKKTKNKV